jgi:hypothetical protein
MLNQSHFLHLILILLIHFLINISGANVKYYLSPGGNDENLGTSPDDAWQTIDQINNMNFEPGDTIAFEGNQIFSGSISFDSTDSGTSDLPLTICSYGTGRATINSRYRVGLYAYNCAGIVIKDLIFTGAGHDDDRGTDGISFYNDLNGDIRLNYIRIENVEVSGYHQTAIELAGWNGLSGFKNVRITNSDVHDNGDKGINVFGYWPPPHGWAHQDIYIGYCKAYNNFGIPGKSPHSGNGIMISQTEGGIIEYCEAYENGSMNSSNAGGPIGIWAWDAKDIIIQYCESHHNKTNNNKDGGGFDLDGGCVNCIMQYNYSHDNSGAGFGIYQFDGAREFSNNTVRYNISENDGLVGGYGGINFWSTNSNGGIQNTKVYNNTIYVSSNTTGAGIGDFAVGITSIYETEIYNNIILTEPDKIALNIPETTGGWYFNGNCYWTIDSDLQINWGLTTYESLFEWRNATAQEKLSEVYTGIQEDPQLTDPGDGGTIGDPTQLPGLPSYRLLPTSPLIDIGLDLLTHFGIDPGNQDFYGTEIPLYEGYDIGANESVEISSLNPVIEDLPAKYLINQNYPNPFNQKTVISYRLATISDVEIKIYNIAGEKVVTLVQSKQAAGNYQVEWDASGQASGVYFSELMTNRYRDVIKMVLLK